MDRILTKSIHFPCSDMPKEMLVVFSENVINKEAENIYEMLRDKGIPCEYTWSFIDFEKENSDQIEHTSQGLLIHLGSVNYSFLMSLDEALVWANAQQYGKISIAGNDYTALAELYSASYNFLEDFDTSDYTSSYKEDEFNTVLLNRINNILEALHAQDFMSEGTDHLTVSDVQPTKTPL